MKSWSNNEIKIYNLSAGKALPEWLAEKKKRSMKSKSLDGRRRLELIQDFDMPGVSTNIKVTPDGNYILATGIYKPRVRCYDVQQLSMKFERCFDSEVVKFIVLSKDYSKLVFLQCDRFIEFHAQYGRYFRMRIPKFGTDLAYHTPSCDLYVVGTSSEAYRLNLELGRFNTPLQTDARCINVCKINPVHHLVTFGTIDGRVEAWDPRSETRCGVLDCAMDALTDDSSGGSGLPGITSLQFKSGLKLGVGTSTGQVLLYDIRSSKPLLVKDHLYSQPITNIDFHHKDEELVLSMDKKVVKIWKEEDGSPYTAVEGGETDYNDLCVVPDTGMFFVANEDRKILSYFVPEMGPAPKWCAFLDSLTEEMEEEEIESVYDDYKFVTENEIHDLGLGHLIGTDLLRGYMHGYYMDMRLYRKVRSAIQPFQFDEFKKKKIQEKLQEQRKNRVKLNTLPQVNKELALKLMSEPARMSKKKSGSLLEDDRFSAMFKDPDFQVDKAAPEYRLLNPVLSSMEKKRTKKLETVFSAVQEGEEEVEGKDSSDESSSDDDKEWVDEVRKERYKLKNEERLKRMEEDYQARIQPTFYELKPGEEFKMQDIQAGEGRKLSKLALGDRVEKESMSVVKSRGPLGGREMTFTMKARRVDRSREDAHKHHMERKKIRRSAGGLKNKKNSWKK